MVVVADFELTVPADSCSHILQCPPPVLLVRRHLAPAEVITHGLQFPAGFRCHVDGPTDSLRRQSEAVASGRVLPSA